MNQDAIPVEIRQDIEKARAVLKRYGCKEIYLCTGSRSDKAKTKRLIEIGVKGMEPRVFFYAYGELYFELGHRVRMYDFGAHKRRFEFLMQEGGCIRIG